MRGLGHRLGNFVCLCNFTHAFNNRAKTKAANEFVELVLISTLLSQTAKSTHVQKLEMIPLKRNDASL